MCVLVENRKKRGKNREVEIREEKCDRRELKKKFRRYCNLKVVLG